MAILRNFSLPTLHFESIVSISPEKEPDFQNIHLLFSSRTCCLRKDITSVYKPSPGWWEKIYGQEVQWDCISMRNLKRQCSLTRKSDRSTFIFLRMLKIHFKKQLPSSQSSTCQWKISWKLVNPSIKTKPSTHSADQILVFYQALAGDPWNRFSPLDTITFKLNSAKSNENYYFYKGQITLCCGWQK